MAEPFQKDVLNPTLDVPTTQEADGSGGRPQPQNGPAAEDLDRRNSVFEGPCGTSIRFQNGPEKEVGKNGVQVEDLVQLCIQRLRFFNEVHGGRFKCRENALAIIRLEEALLWLNRRTQLRQQQGVEGTSGLHVS